MRLTIEQAAVMDRAVALLTELIYSAETNPVERHFFDETRTRINAVRLLQVHDPKEGVTL